MICLINYDLVFIDFVIIHIGKRTPMTFLSQALYSTLLIIGPAVATFFATILVLHLIERVTRKRYQKRMAQQSVKHITRRFPKQPTATSSKAQRVSANVESIAVRAKLHRHEWKSPPVKTLDPNADWN